MTASRKKVIVRKLTQEWLCGYLPSPFMVEAGQFGLLDLDGKVTAITLSDAKWICYVRDFSASASDPEHLRMKAFLRRPRTPGLWLRIKLKDNDCIEGLAQNDVNLLDDNGFLLAPPDSRSNTQRLFVPRSAIAELEILAVIRAKAAPTAAQNLQESLFNPPE